MCEPHKAVQDEELEALRAIFEDDWHDIEAKRTAWGTDGDAGWWEVQLRSTEDDRVRVKLKGRMTKTYPDTPPLLSLIEPIKLNAAHVRTLTKLVQEKAKASVGAPMIFDLADMVREWISVNHVPLPKPGEKEPTLMEEMAQREEAQRAAEAAAQEADKEQRRVASEEKNRLLNEKILLDATRKQERARQALVQAEERHRAEKVSTLADGELEMRELELASPVSIYGYDGQWSSWTLFGAKRETMWTSYTAEPTRIDTNSFVTASTPTVTVQVIDFSNRHYQGPHGRKRIDILCSEINRLKEVHSDHVRKVYAVHRMKSPKGWERLVIMMERIADGGKLKTWLPHEGFGEETAKEYITQILSGLGDLHRLHNYQKQLDTDLILVAPGDDGEVCLKLTGTGYARRIVEYHRSNPFLKMQEEGYPDSWLSPDELEAPYSYSPKRDMWHAGLVLLQLLFGKKCLTTYPDLPTLLQHAPGGLSPWVTDLLTGLLNPSHKKRLTAEESLSRLRAPEEESTRRPQPPRSLSGLSSMTGSFPASTSSSFHQDMLGRSPSRAAGGFFPTANNTLRHYSRYRTDFEEVEFLGKGAFGEVVKARNKLDERPYAIKKVKLRPEDNVNRVLREVNSLSRVSHQYIVRYYSCWLEEVGPPEQAGDESSEAMTASAISTESEDIFAVNFDDLSVSHHSRSASFPRIRFADSRTNSDEEDDDDEDDSDVKHKSRTTSPLSSSSSEESDSGDSDSSAHTIGDPSDRKSKSRAISIPSKISTDFTGTTMDDSSVQRILYIQMEFVEKQTLREAITAGLSEEECWRLFVQILQALAHMSSLGIVHRDLKPSNILLDANGNVKIADFGLSTTDLTAAEPTPNGDLQVTPGDVSDRTSNIGTSLYIAPEVLVSKSYNEKADMYSLGIIFVEMCYAFKTGMERVATLTALRQPDVVFPAAWTQDVKPKQREIINLLLRHSPETRPQATQLLNGPLVPSPDKERKMYEGLITEVTNPRSDKYPDLIDALFESHTNSFGMDTRIDDYTYDNDHDDGHIVWLGVVIDRIAQIFQRHGAVDDYLPLLVPETTLLNVFPDLKPVRLLDENGKFVQLPASNLLRMARSASRRQIERIKRYNIGRRYVELAGGGQPAVHSEFCFDIVSPIRSQVAEAELLEVVDKVMTECQGHRGGGTHTEYEIHVSHESVLAALLSTVPVQLRPRVLRAFKGPAAGVSFESSNTALDAISGLPKQVLHDLEQCAGVGEFSTMRAKMEETFPSMRRKLSTAMDEISTIVAMARACGVSRKILFRPSLSKGAECFRGGFIFQCVRKGKLGEVVAFGGRYDSLLDHFKEPARQSRKVYGVGMSFNGDMLTRMVAKAESALSHRLMNKVREEARSFGVLTPNRCDVYIGTFPHVDISYRLQLVGELWRAGIRADLQYDDGRTEAELLQECKDQNILFLVMVRAPRPQRADVKIIRVLTGRSDDDVERSDLAEWLLEKISEQRRVDASYATGGGPALPALAIKKDDEHGATGPEVDIRLVLPPEPFTSRPGKGKPIRKHRHTTKSVYHQKARDFAASVQSTLPVLGVDLPPELLSQLTFDLGWVTDDDVWRTTSHGLPSSERSYADQVRKAVQEHTKAGGGNLWLFNVRDARGFLLQLSVSK